MKYYLFSLLLCFTVSVANAWTGMVVRVSDGDSITVRTEDGVSHKLRLYGVDSPEIKQDWGKEARKVAFTHAINRLVEVTPLYRDKYKRIVAIVTLPDGRILQEVMLDAGMAWVYERYCKEAFCESWRVKMNHARASRRGLWQEIYPYPPWEWRKAKRQEANAKKWKN